MKNLLAISLLLISQILTAQKIASKTDVEEYNFFYSDTANGEFVYGNYEPNDIIQLKDGSYLIGTTLSISFSSQYKTPKIYDSAYFTKDKVYREKSHTSSGSVFKLNSNFEKEWETIFKGQRVIKILKTPDDRILIVGEVVSMEYVWVAELDKNGNKLWEKHFKYKNDVMVADAGIDENNDIYLLLEASHIVPIRFRNYYGRKRIELFRGSEISSHLALLKVSNKGKKKWLKPIDKRKKYYKYGNNVIINRESVFASYSYSGEKKGESIEGGRLVEFSKSGKKLLTKEIHEQKILLFDNGPVTITSVSNSELFLHKSGELIDSINIPSRRNYFRINNAIKKSDGFLILGSNTDYLLINLGHDLKFAGYWTYPREESNEIRGAVTLDNGDIIIVGKCYRQENAKLIAYTNLIKIKNPFD